MSIRTYGDADVFLDHARAYLERDEAANNLPLGIALRLRQAAAPPAERPYLATVADSQGIAAAAVMAPPHNLVLFSDRPDPTPALELLAQDLLASGWLLPGMSAPAPLAEQFARLWSARSGAAYGLNRHMRIYKLTVVQHPSYPAGELRAATAGDVDLVADWMVAFQAEALHEGSADEIRAAARGRVESGEICLWVDSRPVAMAGATRPTTGGIGVNAVYTPPELRRRGYATACVAALSQRLLDTGGRFCTLFTDLANPTSNSIYQQIGYRPVCDYDEYRFRR